MRHTKEILPTVEKSKEKSLCSLECGNGVLVHAHIYINCTFQFMHICIC